MFYSYCLRGFAIYIITYLQNFTPLSLSWIPPSLFPPPLPLSLAPSDALQKSQLYERKIYPHFLAYFPLILEN